MSEPCAIHNDIHSTSDDEEQEASIDIDKKKAINAHLDFMVIPLRLTTENPEQMITKVINYAFTTEQWKKDMAHAKLTGCRDAYLKNVLTSRQRCLRIIEAYKDGVNRLYFASSTKLTHLSNMLKAYLANEKAELSAAQRKVNVNAEIANFNAMLAIEMHEIGQMQKHFTPIILDETYPLYAVVQYMSDFFRNLVVRETSISAIIADTLMQQKLRQQKGRHDARCPTALTTAFDQKRYDAYWITQVKKGHHPVSPHQVHPTRAQSSNSRNHHNEPLHGHSNANNQRMAHPLADRREMRRRINQMGKINASIMEHKPGEICAVYAVHGRCPNDEGGFCISTNRTTQQQTRWPHICSCGGAHSLFACPNGIIIPKYAQQTQRYAQQSAYDTFLANSNNRPPKQRYRQRQQYQNNNRSYDYDRDRRQYDDRQYYDDRRYDDNRRDDNRRDENRRDNRREEHRNQNDRDRQNGHGNNRQHGQGNGNRRRRR